MIQKGPFTSNQTVKTSKQNNVKQHQTIISFHQIKVPTTSSWIARKTGHQCGRHGSCFFVTSAATKTLNVLFHFQDVEQSSFFLQIHPIILDDFMAVHAVAILDHFGITFFGQGTSCSPSALIATRLVALVLGAFTKEGANRRSPRNATKSLMARKLFLILP